MKWACAFCLGVFVAIGGTSIAGIVIAALTFPRSAIACAAVCGLAFS